MTSISDAAVCGTLYFIIAIGINEARDTSVRFRVTELVGFAVSVFDTLYTARDTVTSKAGRGYHITTIVGEAGDLIIFADNTGRTNSGVRVTNRVACETA